MSIGNAACSQQPLRDLDEAIGTLERHADVVDPAPRPLEGDGVAPKLDAIADSLPIHAEHMCVQASSAPHAPRLGTDPGSIEAEALLAQIRRIEDPLLPVVGAAVESRAGDTLLANKMVQIIELLRTLDARLGNGR